MPNFNKNTSRSYIVETHTDYSYPLGLNYLNLGASFLRNFGAASVRV